jgi:hypothetical protein
MVNNGTHFASGTVLAQSPIDARSNRRVRDGRPTSGEISALKAANLGITLIQNRLHIFYISLTVSFIVTVS